METVSILKKLAFVVGLVVTITIGMQLTSSASTLGFFAGVLVLICSVASFGPPIYRFVREAYKHIDKAFGVVALAILIGAVGGGCTRIEPGHVGIKVHLYGGSKGVDFEPVGVGMQVYNPWYTTFYEFPTFVQTAKWTQSTEEGSPINEEISFNTREGMVITVDISLSYHLEGEKAPAFFAKFRTDDLDIFTHGFMRNVARDAFNDIAPIYSVEDVYGEKKEEMRKNVMARVQQQVMEYGVVLEQFGYIGAMRLPEKVVGALNDKIEATQKAMRIQNEVAQATAEAEKTVATAEGAAKARTIQAKAEADANRIVAASITQELIHYEIARKWDGHRPTVEGSGSGLLLNLPLSSAK